MTYDEVLSVFETLYANDEIAPLDDVLANYVRWFAAQRDRLDGDDIAVLSTVGGALLSAHRSCARRRVRRCGERQRIPQLVLEIHRAARATQWHMFQRRCADVEAEGARVDGQR
ncbi:hypothetical protein AB870_02565 [Pandoraea faecigallinarum]|nr:hypothetical protein [Pandoraea faecigallinarum]AKM29247.3 hypothetical protein AB870_02565 [Pandoraea faecigallinarum]